MKKKLPAMLLSGAMVLSVAAAAYAETKEEYFLDPIVVTAGKVAEKQSEANANISVITREQIEKNHWQDLSAALRNIPGVIVSNHGTGGYTSDQVYINGSKNVVVLIDGVRVTSKGNSLYGFSAHDFTSLEKVERIEVVKGSASTLYGSDAKGGVINIITRKPEGTQTTLSIIGGGNFKEYYSLQNEGKEGRFSWSVGAEKDHFGNYSDANGVTIPANQEAEAYNVKFSARLNDASDLALDYDTYKADYMRANTALYTNARYYGTKENSRLSLVYNYKFSEQAQNQMTLYRNRYHLDDDKDSTAPSAPTTWGHYHWLLDLETRGLQDQFTRKLGKHTIVAGLEYYEDQEKKNYNQTVSNHDLYIQDSWNFAKQWNLTGGLRRNDNSSYGVHNTPSVSIGYKQNDKTDYYIAYKDYFTAPTLDYLYDSYAGDSRLRPEEGNTVEAGVNHKFNNTLTGALHIFRRNSTNTLGYDSITSKYANMGDQTAHGWDAQLSKSWSKRWNATIGYTNTMIDANDQQTANNDGYLPKETWNIGVNYVMDKYDAALLGRGIIDKPGPTSSNGPAFPKATYWVWDLALNYQVRKDMKVFVKANNLFNTYYAEYSNVSNVSYGGLPGDWYVSPGRNYEIGVQYQF